MWRLVVFGLAAVAVAPAEAAVVALYQGGSSPLTQGWVRNSADPTHPIGIIEGSLVEPAPWSVYPAWFVYDWLDDDPQSIWRYTVVPSAGDITAGETLGWTLSARLRLGLTNDVADGSVTLEYRNGSSRFQVMFGASPVSFGIPQGGNLLVTLFGGPAVPSPAGVTRVLSGTSYHEVALAFEPGSGADLYVDGVRVASGYQGVAAGGTHIWFGSASGSTTGFGNYNEVRFETGLQECRDGLDNDGDGVSDLADSGCNASTDPSERDPFHVCDDGRDNDGDAVADGDDPECAQTGGFSERQVLPLTFNWNGIRHPGEAGAPSPLGYRSISDRGIHYLLPQLPPATISGPSGLVYELAADPYALDLVHLGNRNTVDGGSKPLGTLPAWLPDPDQTGAQTSVFDPVQLGPDDGIGILYHASNGGALFAVTLGFASGDPVEVFVHAADWFDNPSVPGPDPDPPTAGVAIQTTAASVPSVKGVDSPVTGFEPQEHLALFEAVISVAELLRDGVADIEGRELVSLTFSDSFDPDVGHAIYAATHGVVAPTAPKTWLRMPVKIDLAHVLGDSPAETGREEAHLVDGSGLATQSGTLVYATDQPNGNNWNTLTSEAAVTFDLGFEQAIDFIQVWNFNDGFGDNDFGATSIDVQVSDVGTNAGDADFSGSPIVATLPIAEATGSLSYPGEGYRFNGAAPSQIPPMLAGVQHDFSGVPLQGRFVRLSGIDGTPDFGGRAGLSEVQLYRMPEPGTLPALCAGAALLAGLARRRRR